MVIIPSATKGDNGLALKTLPNPIPSAQDSIERLKALILNSVNSEESKRAYDHRLFELGFSNRSGNWLHKGDGPSVQGASLCSSTSPS
jgi:hypothetical protein